MIDPVENEISLTGLTTENDHKETASIIKKGLTVWLTGLSGAGKSTIALAVHGHLEARGLHAEILDADELRKHLNRDLGFSKEDRDENVRRIGFVADLLTRHGIIVLVAAIAPYRKTRDEVREKIGRFVEVHVDAPLSLCESRDPKNLYKKVRRGELQNFTGVDDPYEPPLSPDVRCNTDTETIDESAAKVLQTILSRWPERSGH